MVWILRIKNLLPRCCWMECSDMKLKENSIVLEDEIDIRFIKSAMEEYIKQNNTPFNWNEYEAIIERLGQLENKW